MKTILTYAVAVAILAISIPLILIAAIQGKVSLFPSDPPPDGNPPPPGVI